MHKFIMENDYQGQLSTTVEFTVPSEASLTDMCEQFSLYLKACGYHIPEGECLDFVPEDGYSSEGWDSMETATEEHEWIQDKRADQEYPFAPVYEKGYPSYDAVNSKKKLWDATPEEWNQAYKNVTVTYDGELIYKGPRAK